jgi:peptide/nickel transport system permease protein
MGMFILRRVLASIPVLVGILIVTFLLARLIPGDPCKAMLGERATEERCAEFLEREGLTQPIWTQFTIYMERVLSGDLGESIRFQRPVTDILAERLPVTVELSLAAILFATIVGIPLGIVSAYWRNSPLDFGTMLLANVGVSMPVFWLGLMLSYIFGVLLRDTPFSLPPSGRLPAGLIPIPFYSMWDPSITEQSASGILIFLGRLYPLNALLTLNGELFVQSLRFLILPAIAVGTIPMAIIARMTRSSVLETLSQDYVRTARAKGVRELLVVISHALRNALLPVVTIIGLNFGLLISGAVLTETIFSLSGVGRTLVDGITARDYTLVQGFTVVIAFAFVIINMVTDILYSYLDPRIRQQ